uniref:Disease resistance protein At4g27190-like leucine-rich repeats domain-containing protein n=2 Tax=Aegilops tauschii subsp. strangulata TaxID=200361 RepID=A0A452XBE8_AEGTS
KLKPKKEATQARPSNLDPYIVPPSSDMSLLIKVWELQLNILSCKFDRWVRFVDLLVVMPRKKIGPETVEEAVHQIIPYLEDMSSTAHKAIYYDGWRGLSASAVLRAIAQDPPPSLLKKFNKIVHVDCSRWKSRRALQRTIAQELKLPQRVMDIFDRQDEEDNFSGIDEGSRAEIVFIGKEIHQVLTSHKCLVIFHNGSNDMVNLNASGILQGDFFDTKVLWTFRGRFRLSPGISEKADDSHLFICSEDLGYKWNLLLKEEAREIDGYTDKLGETVEECCLYLLALNSQGGNIMDYNWATHASSYWVCDEIIQGGQGDESWEVAAALHKQINTEDYSSNTLPSFGHELKNPPKRWVLSKENSVVPPESTSFFLAAVASESDPPLRPLPNAMFHQSNKLRVLKLCRCTFNFSSPPFHCCHKLRFLGLDSCQDLQPEQDKKQDRQTMDFFKSLWVIDICNTDWDLPSSPEIIEKMAANIREVHIKKGRIWCHSFAWRQLHNLHKLRVIEPTSPWQTGEMDEFTDMVKLEFLDLAGDSTIQVLPSMSGATSLKILVLDGCVGLEHVGPEGLPPSLESFSLDARAREDHKKEAKITRISLAGCARLVNFRLCGSLPHLEDLDLSGTLVKTLDLKDQMVQARRLQKIILWGCMQLLSILSPENGMPKDTILRIDCSVCHVQAEFHQAYATIMDIRFLQTLVLESNVDFCWKSTRFHLKLCVPACSNKVEDQSNKKNTGIGSSAPQIMGPPRPKSLIPNAYITYMDVVADNITDDDGYNSASQFQPLGSHVEIGDGISFTRVVSTGAMKATIFVMNKAKSLHVHGNSSVSTVIPEHMMSIESNVLIWEHLESCHVVRCPKMHTVFNTIYQYIRFPNLVNFCAADLPTTHCIWSKERTLNAEDNLSFAKLQSIHLFSCPRLTFVLVMSVLYTLRSLETLHISFCGDLRKVFPVEPEILTRIATNHKGALEFPNLKRIYLHQLFKLQQICEAKMFAPKLETIRVRGCWRLRCLPVVGCDSRPVVDCEKDWWEKLEWDGLEAGHDPSLLEARHSAYYKKPLPRGSVLW